jgi:hypothetical protein
MKSIISEIKHDLNFIRSHTLQPRWFKALKVFLLLGFLGGYVFLFGWGKMFVFLVSFIVMSAILHFVYRRQTKRWKESWLDFIAYEEDGELKYKRIGKYYYLAIILNAILSYMISQI